MSRLIFSQLEIDDQATFSAAAKTLTGITVEGLEISKEANTVEIEDGQILNESFTGSITIRSVKTAFSDSSNVLDYTTYISSNGSIPSPCSLKLVGANGSDSVFLSGVYLMGHKDFSNGRTEIVLTATKADTNQDVIDTAAQS
jgi:hypothetical protein